MDRDSWDQSGRQDSSHNASTDPQATEAFLAEFAALDLPSQRKRIRELPEAEERGRAAMVLGRFMYEGFVMEELDEPLAQRVKRALLETSADEGESITVRRFALEALSFCTDDPKVLNLIEQGYFSPDPRMQLSALFSMGRSGLERWHGYLLRALDESDKEFRIEAISACGEAQIISAVPELQKMCFDMDRDVRLEAIWALGKIGDERALHTLQRCARDTDPEVSEVAHDAIEELGIAAAIARGEYTEALEEDDLIDLDADDDADLLTTALRESYEEVGIQPDHVSVLGRLDDLATFSTDFTISPFVGLIPYPYPFRPNPVEVAMVFDVPVSVMADPAVGRSYIRARDDGATIE